MSLLPRAVSQPWAKGSVAWDHKHKYAIFYWRDFGHREQSDVQCCFTSTESVRDVAKYLDIWAVINLPRSTTAVTSGEPWWRKERDGLWYFRCSATSKGCGGTLVRIELKHPVRATPNGGGLVAWLNEYIIS